MLSLAVSSLSYGGRTIVHTRGAVLPAAARRALVTALDGETEKSLYALGFNVGRQMGELKSLDGAELDAVLRGMRACVLGHSSGATSCREFSGGGTGYGCGTCGGRGRGCTRVGRLGGRA